MTATYRHDSLVDDGTLTLATGTAVGPEGLVQSPHFFSGFVLDAEQCARGILAVANVAATKLIWLALRNITEDWGRAANHWKSAMNQFAILYGDRFTQPNHGGAKYRG